MLVARRASGSPPAIAISFESDTVSSVETDALIIPTPLGGRATRGPFADVNTALRGSFSEALRDAKLGNTVGSVQVVPTLRRMLAKRIVATRLPQDAWHAEDIRRAYGAATSAAKSAGARMIACSLPEGAPDEAALFRAVTEGVLLALYDFTDHKSDADKDDGPVDFSLTLLAPKTAAAEGGVAEGVAVASGIYLALDLVNEPGSVIYP
ncbi:MAG: hypothetical protein IT537_27075, partial [Hyphomicrobiales bacterium]|nr:hypothetical protein [Hyphomicrobiales bacterium]